MICLGILWPTWKKSAVCTTSTCFSVCWTCICIRFCMFLLFCSSFGEMGTFHLVHFVSMEGLVHFTSDVYELYMSWAELKHWTTSRIWWASWSSWYFELIHVHELADFMNLWTGRAIHAQTCHYKKWIVHSKNGKIMKRQQTTISLSWHFCDTQFGNRFSWPTGWCYSYCPQATNKTNSYEA